MLFPRNPLYRLYIGSVRRFYKCLIIKEVVALTGIEWVSGGFRAVRFNLNRLFSVELIPPQAQPALFGMPGCDRRVTPAFTGVR
jgi:hypothetical protein